MMPGVHALVIHHPMVSPDTIDASMYVGGCAAKLVSPNLTQDGTTPVDLLCVQLAYFLELCEWCTLVRERLGPISWFMPQITARGRVLTPILL